MLKFASKLKTKNIDKETRDLDFDPEKIEATQRMSNGDSGAKFASVIYIVTRNKVLDFAPGNQSTIG
jgi:hypothetical protein